MTRCGLGYAQTAPVRYAVLEVDWDGPIHFNVSISIAISGSSALNLQSGIGEPLTGRQRTFHLFPLAELEYQILHGPIERRERLRERLVYGCYPELLQLPSYWEKESCLSELVQSYLLKDILSLEGIRYSRTVLKLLQLIARQVGAKVSMQELGRQLGISKSDTWIS